MTDKFSGVARPALPDRNTGHLRLKEIRYITCMAEIPAHALHVTSQAAAESAIHAAPPLSQLHWQIPPTAPEGARCLQCGFDVRGMSAASRCPECGTPISRSLQGNFLVFSSTDYVGSLHSGLTMILIAVLLQLALGIAMFIVAISLGVKGALTGGNPAMMNTNLWSSLAGIPITGLLLWGWWQFSAPDPAMIGNEKGQTARTLIRASVIALAAVTVAQLLALSPVALNAVVMTSMGLGVLAAAASITQFFASMVYVRWLAPRIPAPDLAKQANRYLWLLPVIYVVGICVLVGPIVATVMYFFMLNRFRIRLRKIRNEQSAMGFAAAPQ
jgi:ABC-type multidrug transport system fused ATPase/permease subunit